MDLIDTAQKFIKFGKVVQAEKILSGIVASHERKTQEWLAAKSLLAQLKLQCAQWSATITHIEEIEKHHQLSPQLAENLATAREKIRPKHVDRKMYGPLENWAKSFEITPHSNLKIDNAKKIPRSEIINIAHNQNIDNPYQSWNHVRETAWKQVNTLLFEMEPDKKPFQNTWKEIKNSLEKKIEAHPESLAFYFMDDIEADIELILRSAYVDADIHLAKELHRIYSSGAFPCGWEGEYPDGTICYTDEITSSFP